jgi:hypothetical protein
VVGWGGVELEVMGVESMMEHFEVGSFSGSRGLLPQANFLAYLISNLLSFISPSYLINKTASLIACVSNLSRSIYFS